MEKFSPFSIIGENFTVGNFKYVRGDFSIIILEEWQMVGWIDRGHFSDEMLRLFFCELM